jgi:hypothetical protein
MSKRKALDIIGGSLAKKNNFIDIIGTPQVHNVSSLLENKSEAASRSLDKLKQRHTYLNRLDTFKNSLASKPIVSGQKYIWSWIDTSNGMMAKYIMKTLGEKYIEECLDMGIEFHMIHRSVFDNKAQQYTALVDCPNLFNMICDDLKRLKSGRKWVSPFYCEYYAYLHNIIYNNDHMVLAGAWIDTNGNIGNETVMSRGFSADVYVTLKYILNGGFTARGDTDLLGRFIQVTHATHCVKNIENSLCTRSMDDLVEKFRAKKVTSYHYGGKSFQEMRNIAMFL